MKPTSHRIPLTPAERAFVVSVLDAAAIEDRAAAIASVIKAWPEENGMVEIVLLDEDRKVVCEQLGSSRGRRGVCGRHDRDRLPLFDDEDHVFTAGRATLAGTKVRDLWLAFAEYEVDVMAAREILVRVRRRPPVHRAPQARRPLRPRCRALYAHRMHTGEAPPDAVRPPRTGDHDLGWREDPPEGATPASEPGNRAPGPSAIGVDHSLAPSHHEGASKLFAGSQ